MRIHGMLVILSHLNTCNLPYASSMVLYLAFNWFVFKKSNNKCQKHHPIHHHPPQKKKKTFANPPLGYPPVFSMFFVGVRFLSVPKAKATRAPPVFLSWGDFHLPPMVGLPYARSSRPSSGCVTFSLEGFDGSDLEGGSCSSVWYGVQSWWWDEMVVRWVGECDGKLMGKTCSDFCRFSPTIEHR